MPTIVKPDDHATTAPVDAPDVLEELAADPVALATEPLPLLLEDALDPADPVAVAEPETEAPVPVGLTPTRSVKRAEEV